MCTYKSEKTMPVGAKIATKLAGEDHRAETEYKERVPYVIAYNGDGSSKLKDMAVTPQQFFSDGMRLNGDYYITHKIIPPLNRIFKLVGLDLRVWYRDMPRTVKVTSRQLGRSVPTLNSAASSTASTTTTLERFYSIAHCIVCHLQINYPKKKSSSLCEDCARNTGGSTTFQLAARRAALEHAYLDCVRVCQSCMGNSSSRLDERVDCNSLDCNMLYKRITAKRKVDDEAAAAADKHMLITW